MDFVYSQEISPNLYQTDGLDGGIPLRVHKDELSEIIGGLRAQKDWNNHVSAIKDYNGGLGKPYSFISVTVPECLPERLEIMAYANEYAFLYDDEMETLNLKDLKELPVNFRDAWETFESAGLNEDIKSTMRPEKVLQAKILAEMMSIDKERAITSMKAWITFIQVAARARHASFKTLADYVRVRIIDVGELFIFGTITFGMGLTIPEAEYELCMELARPAYAVIGLTNDLYSWEKERVDAQRTNQDYVFNAVWVIMQERSVDEAEAKAICTKEVKRLTAEYCQIVEDTKNNNALSKDVRAYVETLKFSIIGNLVWSIYCPRYREF